MTVQVIYEGRFGNNLLQYVCGRLFAERWGLHLEATLPKNDILYATPNAPGTKFSGSPRVLRGGVNVLDDKFTPGPYVLWGYWCQSRWYEAARQKILSFIRIPAVEAANERGLVSDRDLCMHVRLGDYVPARAMIQPEWYDAILDTEKHERLYIVTDTPDHPYLDHWKARKPTIVSRNPASDFHFMRQFKRIICSNSTFCWWACFFSHAYRIHTYRGTDMMQFSMSEGPRNVIHDGKLIREVDPRP